MNYLSPRIPFHRTSLVIAAVIAFSWLSPSNSFACSIVQDKIFTMVKMVEVVRPVRVVFRGTVVENGGIRDKASVIKVDEVLEGEKLPKIVKVMGFGPGDSDLISDCDLPPTSPQGSRLIVFADRDSSQSDLLHLRWVSRVEVRRTITETAK